MTDSSVHSLSDETRSVASSLQPDSVLEAQDPACLSPQAEIELLERSSLYRELLAEKEEILKHKWIESEKAGCDVGFASARINWRLHHRAEWLKARRNERNP